MDASDRQGQEQIGIVQAVLNRLGAGVRLGVHTLSNFITPNDPYVTPKPDPRLARIGNIESDGRPILGLDSRDLLEITLSGGPGCFLIPAHIWTPWFSVLGSKSGFDSLEECFGESTAHIYAVETGLSSDPAMNWRVSGLDRFALVSNSDAHSAAKIGREANIFDTDISYPAMMNAIKTRAGFLGTIEFFPEEGKYHFDGHRDCGVSLSPGETIHYDYLCPVCGRKLTIGVMNRVECLADRLANQPPPLAEPPATGQARCY